jgi:hypothetical protein
VFAFGALMCYLVLRRVERPKADDELESADDPD